MHSMDASVVVCYRGSGCRNRVKCVTLLGLEQISIIANKYKSQMLTLTQNVPIYVFLKAGITRFLRQYCEQNPADLSPKSKVKVVTCTGDQSVPIFITNETIDIKTRRNED